jgi:hypothetical protein
VRIVEIVGADGKRSVRRPAEAKVVEGDEAVAS